MPNLRRSLDPVSAVIMVALLVIDLLLWQRIIARDPMPVPRLYVFGNDATLIVLNNDVTILIDSGRDASIVQDLDAFLPAESQGHIDLAIISYPAIENYGGDATILGRDSIGAIAYDGRNDPDDARDWKMLLSSIHEKHTPFITLQRGDEILYQNTRIDMIAPASHLSRSADVSDAALVEHVSSPTFTAVILPVIGTHAARELASFNMQQANIIVAQGKMKSAVASFEPSLRSEIVNGDSGTIMVAKTAGALRIFEQKAE